MIEKKDIIDTLNKLSREEGIFIDENEIENHINNIRNLIPDNLTQEKVEQRISVYFNDYSLVTSLLANESESWGIVSKHVSVLLRRKYMRSDQNSDFSYDDLTQSVMIEIIKGLSGFSYRSSFSTWLHTVTIATIAKEFRKNHAKKRSSLAVSYNKDDIILYSEESTIPENQVEEKLLREKIETTLSNHSEKMAIVFNMMVEQGLTARETGEALHLHHSRVRALLLRAKSILRENAQIRDWLLESRRSDTP